MLSETELSLEIARREGGYKNLNMGEIKEVQRHLLDILCTNLNKDELLLFIGHHTKLMNNRIRREKRKE